jgi:hypothetical protein
MKFFTRCTFIPLSSGSDINLRTSVMKGIIILYLASIGIFIGINLRTSAYSDKIQDNNAPYIHYQVNIHPDYNITHDACPLMVQMTNGAGILIGQPQLYHNGLNTYNFYEAGPVTGKRMAQLLNTDEGLPENVCILVSLWDSKTGTFYRGGNYKFDLYGSSRDQVAPDNSTVNQ